MKHRWLRHANAAEVLVGTTHFCDCGLMRQWDGKRWLFAELEPSGRVFENAWSVNDRPCKSIAWVAGARKEAWDSLMRRFVVAEGGQ